MRKVTDVIHLACISNDPSFDLNPQLGKSINLDAFEPLVQIAPRAGVKRFIYPSSSSVYGVKNEDQVTEELALEPLTDYSKFKADCEKILFEYNSNNFVTTILRPENLPSLTSVEPGPWCPGISSKTPDFRQASTKFLCQST